MGNIPNSLRFKVLQRDNFRCVYCGAASSATQLHIDHVEPKSKGGENEIDNYVAACASCNSGKSAGDVLGKRDEQSKNNGLPYDPNDPLVGKCFAIFSEPRQPDVQGYVYAKVKDGVYLLYDFDGMLGQPNKMHLVPIERMLNPDLKYPKDCFCFFENDEHLRNWIVAWGKGDAARDARNDARQREEAELDEASRLHRERNPTAEGGK